MIFINNVHSSNFDLLNSFPNEKVENDLPNTIPLNANTANNNFKNGTNMFDLFGSLGGGDGNNILGGWSNFSRGPMENASAPVNQPEQKPSDPFAEFGKKKQS